ncbi:MAG: hypothetical protein Q7V88_12920 [Actinomycetota bacterium]|nr:hypothetical protein [Actinomycetota bacterium]
MHTTTIHTDTTHTDNTHTDSTHTDSTGRRHGLAGRCGRMLRHTLGVAAISAVALTAVGGDTPASAWTFYSTTGRPGSVVLPTMMVTEVYYANYTQMSLMGNTGVVVYRSPASTGAQNVGAIYTAQQFVNNQWVNVYSSPVITGYIPAGRSSVTLVRPNLQPSTARGYFRVVFTLAWTDTANRYLASAFVTPTNANDLVCNTTSRWCIASPGYVRTGGYLTNAW